MDQGRLDADASENNDRFKAVFHQSLDAILIVNGDNGEILSVNQAVGKILGYAEDALIGRPFEALFMPEADADRKLTIKDFQVHGTVLEGQAFRHADGSVCYVDQTVTLIPWHGRSAILVTLRDISQRRAAEAERERLIQELQAALDQVKTLSGLLPICSGCHKIRDDKGYWNRVVSLCDMWFKGRSKGALAGPETTGVLPGSRCDRSGPLPSWAFSTPTFSVSRCLWWATGDQAVF